MVRLFDLTALHEQGFFQSSSIGVTMILDTASQ